MSFEVTGKLYKKFDSAQVTASFRKREFVLEIEDGNYPQIIKFQLTQNNCEKLDPFNEGDMVKVGFNLRGREYSKDGRTSYFTNLDAWRIDNAAPANAPTPPQDAPFGNEDFPSADSAPPMPGMNDDLPF